MATGCYRHTAIAPNPTTGLLPSPTRDPISVRTFLRKCFLTQYFLFGLGKLSPKTYSGSKRGSLLPGATLPLQFVPRISNADPEICVEWEYYNYHANATFVMNRHCQANHAERRTCISTQYAICEDHGGECQGNKRCSEWPAPYAHRIGPSTADTWCMTIEDHGIFGTIDAIWWNDQMRNLESYGGQGRGSPAQGDVLALCEGLCQAEIGMPVLKGAKHATNHQWVIQQMDDMCDSCK